jgi:hypothetical protein
MYQHHPMFPLTANKYMPHIIALAEGDPSPEKLDTSKLRLCDVVATMLYRLDCQLPGILKRFYGTEQKEESGLAPSLRGRPEAIEVWQQASTASTHYSKQEPGAGMKTTL